MANREPPPGWYEYPDGTERYWTGTDWADDEPHREMGRYPADGDQPPPTSAAGWYPDPPGLERWFDGEEWTDQYRTPKRKFPVWLRVAVGVAAVLGFLALVGVIDVDKAFHRVKGEDPNTAISEWVQDSIQDKLDTDPDIAPYRLQVVKVEVIHSSDNEYKGIATIRTRKGNEHDVLVDITSDGSHGMWSAPPGSFLFAFQE